MTRRVIASPVPDARLVDWLRENMERHKGYTVNQLSCLARRLDPDIRAALLYLVQRLEVNQRGNIFWRGEQTLFRGN